MAEKTHALLLAGALVFSGCVAGRRADGDRYMAQARYPAAVRAYQDVLQRRPGDLRAQVGQARALLRADQPQAALEPARMAMEQADPQGIALYAEALIRTGDAETALTLLATPGISSTETAWARALNRPSIRRSATGSPLSSRRFTPM